MAKRSLGSLLMLMCSSVVWKSHKKSLEDQRRSKNSKRQ